MYLRAYTSAGLQEQAQHGHFRHHVSHGAGALMLHLDIGPDAHLAMDAEACQALADELQEALETLRINAETIAIAEASS